MNRTATLPLSSLSAGIAVSAAATANATDHADTAAGTPRRALPPGTPLAARALLRLLARWRTGCLHLTLPGGVSWTVGHDAAGGAAALQVLDWRACALVLRSGDIGFGEAVRRGWLASPDFPTLLRLAMRNEDLMARTVHGTRWMGWLHRLRHAARRNSRAGSRANILAHYDIGNAFYATWLDAGWTYSSAIFHGDRTQSLEQAQEAKYARVIDTLGLEPGMRVLEIGCGWGGFALAAAARGVHVHGVTISPSQLEVARARVAAAGLERHARLELCDYRDLAGPQAGHYDAIVSIEMFEAVGEAYWRGWFERVHALLAPGGQALVQTITIAEPRFARYRASSDFIRHHIFPGGMLPTPGRFVRAAGEAGLAVRDAFAFGADYAETLRRWRARFEAAQAALQGQGLDQGFLRLWQLYLSYCEAGFEEERIDVLQFLLRRA